MGFLRKFSLFVVVASLVAGVALNSTVASNCEYMRASSSNSMNGDETTDIKLGVFRYSVNIPGNEFDTGGECINYDDEEGDAINLKWQVQTARICAIIAPICGIILVIVVVLTQCCCPLPCMGILIGLCYFGCHVGTALVWMARLNEVCDTVLGGCDWGDGAVLNLCAQLVYLLAAIFHRCLPDPKVAQAERRADRAEGQQQEAAQQYEAEMGQATASSAGNDADVKRLQSELDKQKQATQTAEQATASLQKEYTAQTEELKKQRNLLAAATAATGTAAGAEAAKIKKLQEQLEEKDKLLQQNKHLSEKQAVTAATGTAAGTEAAKIKEMQKELEEKDKLLREQTKELEAADVSKAKMEEENKKTEAALAVATGVSATVGVAELAKIKSLEEKLKKSKAELEAAKATNAKAEEENTNTKAALAIATAASSTVAVGEAAKINSLTEELEEARNEAEELRTELAELKAQENTPASTATVPIANEDVEMDLNKESTVATSERDSVHIDDADIDDSTQWHKTSSYAVRIHHKLGSVMLDETEMKFICTKEEDADQTFSWSSVKKIQRNPTGSAKALLKITASKGEITVIQLKNRKVLNELYTDATHWLEESSNESSKPDPPDADQNDAVEPTG